MAAAYNLNWLVMHTFLELQCKTPHSGRIQGLEVLFFKIVLVFSTILSPVFLSDFAVTA